MVDIKEIDKSIIIQKIWISLSLKLFFENLKNKQKVQFRQQIQNVLDKYRTLHPTTKFTLFNSTWNTYVLIKLISRPDTFTGTYFKTVAFAEISKRKKYFSNFFMIFQIIFDIKIVQAIMSKEHYRLIYLKNMKR